MRFAKQLRSVGLDQLTVFELITAVAYLYFAREKADLAVIEVGLGGRLDATNVNRTALVTVITALGYDHTDRLGHSLAEIAQEKAGILKSGFPWYSITPEMQSRTRKKPGRPGSYIAGKAQTQGLDSAWFLSKHKDLCPLLQARPSSYQGQSYQISLRGDYQRQNACVALSARQGTLPGPGHKCGS